MRSPAPVSKEGTRGDAPAGARKSMAIVTTVWRYLSHAQHMGDRFLVGYPYEGRWHRPAIDVVSLYVDQKPEDDQSAERAASFGFKVYPTIAQALRRGGREARGRRRADHRRARQLPEQREGPDPLPALRVLPPGGRRLRGRRPRRAGLQRQASVVQLHQGEGHGGHLEAPRLPVPRRLVAAGHLAAAAGRAAPRLRDRRRPHGRRRRVRPDGLSRTRGHAVHGRAPARRRDRRAAGAARPGRRRLEGRRCQTLVVGAPRIGPLAVRLPPGPHGDATAGRRTLPPGERSRPWCETRPRTSSSTSTAHAPPCSCSTAPSRTTTSPPASEGCPIPSPASSSSHRSRTSPTRRA